MYENLIIGVDGRDAAALAGLLAAPGAGRHLAYIDANLHNGRGSDHDLYLRPADPQSVPALVNTERELAGGAAPLIRVSAESVASGLARSRAAIPRTA